MRAEYKDLYEKFGLNIVYYRNRKKLTQLQLAKLSDVDRDPLHFDHRFDIPSYKQRTVLVD